MAWILFFNSTFFSYNLLTIKLNLTIKSYILFFFNYYLFYLFIFGCAGSLFLCEGPPPSCGKRGPPLIAVRGPPTIAASPAAEHTGSRRAGPAAVAHGPSCSAACGIPPDQGSNPRPLHRQADSQPLRHQGSPQLNFLKNELLCLNGYYNFLKIQI